MKIRRNRLARLVTRHVTLSVAVATFSVWLALAPARPPGAARAAEGKSVTAPKAGGEDLSALLPRLKPTAPEESARTFRVEPGFHLDLVAAEPSVTDPVAAAWDEDGRLWVCELWNYPGVPKAGEPLGRIRLLETTRGDGTYDRSTIFADDVRWPSGVLPWDGGVFVLSSPDLWYFKDTTGKGKADLRKKVYTGFHGNTYEIPNTMQWGPDNKVYLCASYAGGSVKPADKADDKDFPAASGRNFRFDPRAALRGEPCEVVSGGGEWGNTLDDWGDLFNCDATHLCFHAVLPHDELARNPYLGVSQVREDCAGEWARVFPISPEEPWKVLRQKLWSRWVNTSGDMKSSRFPRTELEPHGYATAAAGLTVYRGSAYPPAYRNSAFIGEPANNVVARLTLEPAGVGFKTGRPDAESKKEFIASTDNWFRPVNFSNGPDGCLYVISMYREVVEDESAIPLDILKHLDLYSGRDRGRIYRITPDGFPLHGIPHVFPHMSDSNTVGLVAALTHPDGWWRDTAHRLLYERQDKSAVEPLRALVRNANMLPQARLQALWALQGLGALDEATVLAATGDPDGHVREHAVRLAEGLPEGSGPLRRKVEAMADDPEVRVRFRAAFAIGRVPDESAVAALGRIAKRDLDDQWVRTAVAAAVPDRAGALFARLVADPEFLARERSSLLLGQLVQIVGARNEAAEVQALMAALTGAELAGHDRTRRALLGELAGGLAHAGSSLGQQLRDSGARGASLQASFDKLFGQARASALDDSRDEKERIDAVAVLAYAPYADAAEALTSLLSPEQPAAVQLAAVRALSAHADPAVGKVLAERFPTFGPGVRPDVIDALFRRADRLPALLDAIEARKVPAGELVPGRRGALLKNEDPAVRARARKLLGPESATDKQQLIDRYRRETAGLAGDSHRGAVVFRNTCAICHRPEHGERPGPNLATLDDRSPDRLLTDILDPNREVKPAFVAYRLVTRDEQDLSGVIAGETAASVTLRFPGGGEETVLRKNIKTLASTGLSLMPEGFENGINSQQMADLLRFLAELK